MLPQVPCMLWSCSVLQTSRNCPPGYCAHYPHCIYAVFICFENNVFNLLVFCQSMWVNELDKIFSWCGSAHPRRLLGLWWCLCHNFFRTLGDNHLTAIEGAKTNCIRGKQKDPIPCNLAITPFSFHRVLPSPPPNSYHETRFVHSSYTGFEGHLRRSTAHQLHRSLLQFMCIFGT